MILTIEIDSDTERSLQTLAERDARTSGEIAIELLKAELARRNVVRGEAIASVIDRIREGVAQRGLLPASAFDKRLAYEDAEEA